MLRLALVLLMVSSCAQIGAGTEVDQPSRADSSDSQADEIRLEIPPYATESQLLWKGRVLGRATESLSATADGYILRRQERLRFRRRDTVATLSLAIEITTDHSLVGRQVVVRVNGPSGSTVDRAQRSDDGSWYIERAGLAVRQAPRDAVPVELVPVIMMARGLDSYDGAVLLPGRAFASARFIVSPSGESHEAKLLTPAGTERYFIELSEDGFARSTRGPGPLTTVPPDKRVKAGGPPPEVVVSSAIRVSGSPSSRLIIDGVDGAAPGPIPGQTVHAEGGSWTVSFAPPAVGRSSRLRELETLVAITSERLANDLSRSATSPREALNLDRGDCTAHALLFTELAKARGIESRIVTGYRIEGGRMLRHRWAQAQLGGVWVTVDPTYGEAPAAPRRLVALYAHSAAPEAIAVADFAFAATRSAKAQYR